MKKSNLLKIDMGEDIAHAKVGMKDDDVNTFNNIRESTILKRKKYKEKMKSKKQPHKGLYNGF